MFIEVAGKCRLIIAISLPPTVCTVKPLSKVRIRHIILAGYELFRCFDTLYEHIIRWWHGPVNISEMFAECVNAAIAGLAALTVEI